MRAIDIDDETLMAFADGELDAETVARIDAALATDDELAARLAVFIETRARLASEFKPLVDEPVPDALSAAIRSMVASDIAQAERKTEQRDAAPAVSAKAFDRAPRARHAKRKKAEASRSGWFGVIARRASVWQALAASLLVVVGGAGGYVIGLPDTAGRDDLLVDKALFAVLSDTPSGVSKPVGDRTFEPVLSFRLADGTLCREFRVLRQEGGSVIGLACHENGSWKTHLAMATTRPQEGYTPAGSTETLDAYLGSIGAGPALTNDEERAALGTLLK